MSWILTATGRQLDLQMPMTAQVNIMDIAWALAQLPRFTGHCRRPYSVAEHSLLVAEICERDSQLHLDPEGLMAALLHDAAEAYMGDCSSPLKTLLGGSWYAIERRVHAAIERAFDFRTTLSTRAAIKHADLVALATEKRDLMPHHGAGEQPWPCLRGIEPVAWIDLADPSRTQHDWEFWRDRFLDKFHELEFARQQQLGGCSRHGAAERSTSTTPAPTL